MAPLISSKFLGSSLALLFLTVGLGGLGTKSLYAQAGRLQVLVRDAASLEPLSGAEVLLAHSQPPRGSLSNAKGLADLSIGHRKHFEVWVFYQGYSPTMLKELQIPPGGLLQVEALMQSVSDTIAAVEVMAAKKRGAAHNPWIQMSARGLNLEKTKRLAAGLGDPARTVLSLPGVIGANDEGNELIIRGNGPRQLQWRLQGLDIPNPNHFVNGPGSSGGAVLMLSGASLASADFISGNYPAEYGQALAGVIDMQLAEGNVHEHQYELSAGLMGFTAMAQGPLSKSIRSSYLFNYRYSNLHLLQAAGLGVIGSNVPPKYQDFSINLKLATPRMGYLNLWFLGGQSKAGFKAERDTSLWEAPHHAQERSENQSLAVGGLKHLFRFPKHQAFCLTSLGLSHTQSRQTHHQLDANFNRQLLEGQKSSNRSVHLHSFFQQKINSSLKWRIGLQAKLSKALLEHESLNNKEKQAAYPLNAALYGEISWQWRARWNLQLGFRKSYYSLNESLSVDPRLSTTYHMDRHRRLSFGISRLSSSEHFSLYQSHPANSKLKNSQAWQSTLSYHQLLLEKMELSVELYGQQLRNIPLRADDSLGLSSLLNAKEHRFSSPYTNGSEGRSFGLEISLERSMTYGYYWQMSASFNRSEFKKTQDIYYQVSRFSTAYAFSFTAGKEWEWHKGHIGLNLRGQFHANINYIPLNLAESNVQGRAVYQKSQGYSGSYPDYFRLDLGLSYQVDFRSWSWEIRLDLQNFSNHQNVLSHYYHPEERKTAYHFQNGILPVLAFSVVF